jgi:hypothetical protein
MVMEEDGYTSNTTTSSSVMIGAVVRTVTYPVEGMDIPPMERNVLIGAGACSQTFDSVVIGACAINTYSLKTNEYDMKYISGEGSVAIGSNAVTSAKNSIAIGYDAKVEGDESISIGYTSRVHGKNAIAIGANTSGDYEISGPDDNEIAIGNSLSSKLTLGDNVIDLYRIGKNGYNEDVFIPGLIFDKIPRVQSELEPDDDYSLATKKYVDDNIPAMSNYLTTSSASTTYATKTDLTSYATKSLIFDGGNTEKSVMIGYGTSTAFDNSVVLGYYAKSYKATGDTITVGSNVIIGDGALSYTHFGIALGFSAANYNPAKLENGEPVYDEETGNKVFVGQRSVAIGPDTQTNNDNTIAIGNYAGCWGENSVAIGNTAQAKRNNSIAIGSGTENVVENSAVIGNTAVKTITLGAITITTDGASTITFSVGTKSFTINLS